MDKYSVIKLWIQECVNRRTNKVIYRHNLNQNDKSFSEIMDILEEAVYEYEVSFSIEVDDVLGVVDIYLDTSSLPDEALE